MTVEYIMAKQIFPPEILNNTTEVYHTKIHTRSKVIYWIILCLILVLFASLILVKVDITMQSRGIVRSPMDNIVIQSGVYGEIIHYTLSENKTVKKGDTLLILRDEKLSEKQDLYRKKITKNLDFIADIDLLLHKKKPTHSFKYISEYNRYIAKIKGLQTTVNYNKQQLDIDTELKNKNVISTFEYLKTKNSYNNAIEQLDYLKKEFYNIWQTEHTNLLLENKELTSSIHQIEEEKQQYIITAPVSGKLLQVAGYNTGNFIVPAQQIAVISNNDSLIAECYVSPSDIAYIHLKQHVNFQFDAFNYREWGMLKGSVKEILHDVILIDKTPMFRVRFVLQDNTLQLKNGYKGNVKKGLSYTARFHLNRRTLWQLLFDKLDNWLNPKIINPKAK